MKGNARLSKCEMEEYTQSVEDTVNILASVETWGFTFANTNTLALNSTRACESMPSFRRGAGHYDDGRSCIFGTGSVPNASPWQTLSLFRP